MAEDIPTVKESVERFADLLRERKRISAIYLYGSQVTGEAHTWSDIDVAVVSPDFAENLFQARLTLLRLAAQVDDRIEPTPFTPESFTLSDPLASEVQRTGVRIL